MYIPESEFEEIYEDFEKHLGRGLLAEEKEFLRKLVEAGSGDILRQMEDFANSLCEGFKAIIEKK